MVRLDNPAGIVCSQALTISEVNARTTVSDTVMIEQQSEQRGAGGYNH
jgi:hypothetical protein